MREVRPGPYATTPHDQRQVAVALRVRLDLISHDERRGRTRSRKGSDETYPKYPCTDTRARPGSEISCRSARCSLYGSRLSPVDIVQIVGASPVLDAYTVQRPLYAASAPAGYKHPF